jgi:hypothetical protein
MGCKSSSAATGIRAGLANTSCLARDGDRRYSKVVVLVGGTKPEADYSATLSDIVAWFGNPDNLETWQKTNRGQATDLWSRF